MVRTDSCHLSGLTDLLLVEIRAMILIHGLPSDESSLRCHQLLHKVEVDLQSKLSEETSSVTIKTALAAVISEIAK